MFLTPDAKPLMGGTYFPPRDRDDQVGFLTVLDRVQQAWTDEAEKWQKTGDSLADYVAEIAARNGRMLKPPKLEQPLVDGVLRVLLTRFDATYGGFGYDPASPRQSKFPEPPNLVFLLDQAQRGNKIGRKDAARHAGKNFAWRHSRSRRRRLSSLQHRSLLAGARTSKKCSTTTANSPASTRGPTN